MTADEKKDFVLDLVGSVLNTMLVDIYPKRVFKIVK